MLGWECKKVDTKVGGTRSKFWGKSENGFFRTRRETNVTFRLVKQVG